MFLMGSERNDFVIFSRHNAETNWAKCENVKNTIQLTLPFPSSLLSPRFYRILLLRREQSSRNSASPIAISCLSDFLE